MKEDFLNIDNILKLEPRLNDTICFIEADNDHIRFLRELHTGQLIYTNSLIKPIILSWESDLIGRIIKLRDPVYIELTFALINNKRICFYWSHASIVNWITIENWIKEIFPDVLRTNVSNFQLIITKITS